MPLAPGTRLGPYEILSALGAGGMGEVYRARDTKLDRDVAIKVLPELFVSDPERVARFQREAKTLAALNHPHIGGIYGLEDAGGVRALVLELVEGPTLADRIAQGPIPLDEAMPIARQIAEALEAAHEAGIIHRDLKPANIKLRPDGTVKVLDFGLAKAMEPASAMSVNAMTSPTLSIHATQAGVILGTAAYMSPEQTAGKPVDKRSDLWAFGVVLMEMLTGRQVFGGETVSHVLASVLKDAPDLGALPSETPASIRKLLRRCLEKDRRNRWADAADARLEIEDALAGSSQDVASTTELPGPPHASRPRTVPLVGTFVAGVVLAVAGTLLLLRIPATRALAGISSSATASAVTYKPLSFEPGGNTDPVWSPDGKGIAFAARQSEDEPFQVYVRYLDSSTSTQLTHTEANAQPIAWTTAGRIVFRSTVTPAGLWSISQTGGQAEPLLRVGVVGVASITASRDGSVVAYYGQQDGKYGIWISAAAGSPPTHYAPAPFEADVSVNQPAVRFSPDGKRLLLFCNTTRGEEAWLMPYPADSSRPPRQILQHALKGSSYTPRFSWMPDNRRVVMSFASASEPSRLYVADTVAGSTSVLSSGTTSELQPAVSPDGTRLAFMEETNDYNVLQVDVRTGDVSPILATRRNEDMPAWAMKSDVMAYVTDRGGGPEIWLHQPGRPDRPVVTASDFPQSATLSFMSPVVSPDGGRIIYGRIDPGGADVMWLSSLSGGAPVRANTSVQHEEYAGSWSPDGIWFVYWDETSASLNRIRTTGQATPEVLVPHIGNRGSAVPVWSPTGEWILHNRDGWRLLSSDGKTERDLGLKARVCAFSRDGAQLHCVRTEGPRGVLFARPVAGGPERVIARLAPSQVPSTGVGPSLRMTLTPDGQFLTFSAAKTESSLWLLEGIGAR